MGKYNIVSENGKTYYETDKKIIDVCCSTKSFWFDKNDDRVLFQDIREGELSWNNGGRSQTYVIEPDIVGDVTCMPFKDDTFVLCVFDPPHLIITPTTFTAKHYGTLYNLDWRVFLKQAFSECFRIIKPDGILIFKWCEYDIPLKDVLALTDAKPLFGHISGKRSLTHWVSFMK